MTTSLGADARLIPSAAADAALDRQEARHDLGAALIDLIAVARVNVKAKLLIALREYANEIGEIAQQVPGGKSADVKEVEGMLDDLLGELEFASRESIERHIEED